MLLDVQVTWAVGSVFVGVVAWAVLASGFSWRWLAFFSAMPPAIVLMCFVYMPESPRWLLVNGQHDKAKKVLTYIARRNGVELGDFTLINTEPVRRLRLAVV